MSKTAAIIPCYNEAKRLSYQAFEVFLTNTADIDIFFVNDGSADRTAAILEQVREKFPARISIISLRKNMGKAGAVREGMLLAMVKDQYTHVGYLDADLSTSLQEFMHLYIALTESKADYIYGSRIKMLQTNIERSFFRHISGRIIATIIDLRLQLEIYDTQCGAKWFSAALVKGFCQEPFKTKWLFDIEIFLRIKKLFPGAAGIERPLSHWKDPRGSRIGILDFPAVCKEIITLFKFYKKF